MNAGEFHKKIGLISVGCKKSPCDIETAEPVTSPLAFRLTSEHILYNQTMKTILPSISLFLSFILAAGCCVSHPPSKLRRDSVSEPAVSQQSVPPAKQPTAIQANASMVEGIIQTVSVDTARWNYHIDLLVVAVKSTPNSTSLAESGQILSVTPQYVLDEQGAIDLGNVRNMSLMKLRSTARAGDTLRGTISLRPDRTWALLDLSE
jgi:hypothetical protein